MRDAFAVVASGGYRTFGEFPAAALRSSATTPLEDEFPRVFSPPDVSGPDLVSVIDLLALPS